MLGWLYRIIIGKFDTCDHIWVTVKTGIINTDCGTKAYYDKECSKCGKMRTWRI